MPRTTMLESTIDYHFDNRPLNNDSSDTSEQKAKLKLYGGDAKTNKVVPVKRDKSERYANKFGSSSKLERWNNKAIKFAELLRQGNV